MPINSFLYPGAKVVPPFTVANSIRLNQGDDPDMKKTIGAPTSARKFSVSCWVKLSNLGVQRNLWGLGATSGATGLSVRFQDDDTLDFFDYNGSGNNFGAILGGFAVWFLWIEAAPIALFLINFFTAGMSETHALKLHLIESVHYFRFLMMGLGLLLIMRYRPKGILPEKIEIK